MHTGGFALKWLYYELFIPYTVRDPTSRKGILLPEVDKYLGSTALILFYSHYLFGLHKAVYALIFEKVTPSTAGFL